MPLRVLIVDDSSSMRAVVKKTLAAAGYAVQTCLEAPDGAQALEILRGLRGINLVGMDVVEVAPPYDHAEVTALAGATLAMEMICLYAARHKL